MVKRVDEQTTFSFEYNGNKVTLKADFNSFVKLDKIAKSLETPENGFGLLGRFLELGEIEVFPYILQAMADVELTIDEIKKNLLGMRKNNVLFMANVINFLVTEELLPQSDEKEEKN